MEDKIVNLKIKADLQPVKKGLEDVKKGTEDVSKASEAATSKIDSLSGGAISGFKGMVSGLTGVAGGFKTVGGAIALSGLGLIVLVIASITAAFKNTEAGQNKFAKLMGIIGSVTGNLIDTLSNLGEKIISVFENPVKSIQDFGKLITTNITNRLNGLLELIPAIGKAISLAFKGEFAKAGETAFNSITKVTTGISNASSKLKGLVKGTKEYAAEILREGQIAAKIADDRAKADIIERNLIAEKSNAQNKINVLREKSADSERFSAKERAGFLQSANDISDKLALKEIQVAKLRFNAKSAENALSGSTKEDLLEEANLKARVLDIDTQRLDSQRRITSQLRAALKEDVNKQKQAGAEKQKITEEANKVKKEAEKKVSDEAKAAAKKSLDDANAIRIALEQSQETPAQKENREFAEKKIVLDANNLSTELLEQVHQENLNKITTDSFAKDADAAIKKTADEKVESDKRKEIARLESESKLKMLGAVSAGLSIAAQELGESTAAGKIAAVAAASISTYTAIAGQLSAFSKVPIPGYAIAQALVTGATGLLQVKKILSVKTPKGGGGGSAPTINAAGGGPAAPAFNVIGASPANQLAQTIGAQNNVPIKAFVVSSDVTTAQALDRNIIKSATLG
jgi:hypothetical protein